MRTDGRSKKTCVFVIVRKMFIDFSNDGRIVGMANDSKQSCQCLPTAAFVFGRVAFIEP